MDRDLAEEVRQFRSPADGETRMFYEIVVAPGYTPEGLAHLRGKSKTLRILESQPRAPSGRQLRQISGARAQGAMFDPCAEVCASAPLLLHVLVLACKEWSGSTPWLQAM